MGKGTILVVEDEAMIGLEVSLVLERQGYHVPPVVMYGDDVVGAVMKSKPDLILCDVRLGGFLDGIAAIERIRLVNPSVPVVFMTAYGDPSTMKRAQKAEPFAILDKPVMHELLIYTIDGALGNQVGLESNPT